MPRRSRHQLIHKHAPQDGADVADPPGLRQRGGSWEIRVRVPKRLRGILPTEIVKSFGGVSKEEARRRYWIERANIERRFETAEMPQGLIRPLHAPPARIPTSEDAPSLTEEQRIGIARRFLEELETATSPIPLHDEEQEERRAALIEETGQLARSDVIEDATFQSTVNNFAARIGLRIPPGELFAFYTAVKEAWKEHLSRENARLNGATVASINPAFAGVRAGVVSEDTSSQTLGDAISMYIGAPSRSANAASSLKMDRSRLRVLQELVGAARPVRSITRADMRSYAEKLMKLPAHYAQRFRGRTLLDAISAGEATNAPTLSATTIKRNLEAARSFFGWLEKQELILKNPALHVDGPKAPKKSKRRPFTSAEMRALLQACPRGGLDGKDGWTYWCTRIAMLHGFRVTEPLGMQVQDLIQRGSIWVFRLQANEVRALKTDATEREVPVHPRLIELGIVELATNRQPNDLLIPGVRRGKDGTLEAPTKHMMRVVRKHVSRDPDLTFHSLRHSFRDAMRDAGFPRSVEERLGGWKTSSNDVMDGYGQGHRLETLQEWIGKVSYEGVTID